MAVSDAAVLRSSDGVPVPQIYVPSLNAFVPWIGNGTVLGGGGGNSRLVMADGVTPLGDATNPIRTNPTGTTTQPTADAALAALIGSLSDTDATANGPVIGILKRIRTILEAEVGATLTTRLDGVNDAVGLWHNDDSVFSMATHDAITTDVTLVAAVASQNVYVRALWMFNMDGANHRSVQIKEGTGTVKFLMSAGAAGRGSGPVKPIKPWKLATNTALVTKTPTATVSGQPVYVIAETYTRAP